MTRARTGRVPVVIAALTLAALCGQLPAAGGAPPADTPVVRISIAFAPGFPIYRDCTGADQPYSDPDGFLVERSGSLMGDLEVPLSFAGSMVGALDEVPDSVTIPAGEASAAVILTLNGPGPGSLSVSLRDGPHHGLGDPATVDLAVGPSEVAFDCAAPLGLDPARLEQTIEVGEVPAPLDVPFARATGSRDAPAPEQVTTHVVDGNLPPGLAYVDDRWEGAATTVGESRFRVAVCVDAGAFAPVDVCPGSAEVRITVVAGGGDRVDPGPTAPPATPITGPARFTG